MKEDIVYTQRTVHIHLLVSVQDDMRGRRRNGDKMSDEEVRDRIVTCLRQWVANPAREDAGITTVYGRYK